MLKKCSKCWIEKEHHEFYKNKKLKYGVSNICKKCASAYGRSRRKKLSKRKTEDIIIPKNKKCNGCGETKPWNMFYRKKHNSVGLTSYCIECSNKKYIKYVQKNKDRIVVNIPKNKRCPKCKLMKTANCFVKDKSRKDGLASGCKDCRRGSIILGNAKRRATKISVEEMFSSEDKELVMISTQKECMRCGKVNDLCVDHFKPLCKGNPLSILNATILCRSCNSQKQAKNPEDFFTEEEYSEILTAMSFAHILKHGVY